MRMEALCKRFHMIQILSPKTYVEKLVDKYSSSFSTYAALSTTYATPCFKKDRRENNHPPLPTNPIHLSLYRIVLPDEKSISLMAVILYHPITTSPPHLPTYPSHFLTPLIIYRIYCHPTCYPLHHRLFPPSPVSRPEPSRLPLLHILPPTLPVPSLSNLVPTGLVSLRYAINIT